MTTVGTLAQKKTKLKQSGSALYTRQYSPEFSVAMSPHSQQARLNGAFTLGPIMDSTETLGGATVDTSSDSEDQLRLALVIIVRTSIFFDTTPPPPFKYSLPLYFFFEFFEIWPKGGGGI